MESEGRANERERIGALCGAVEPRDPPASRRGIPQRGGPRGGPRRGAPNLNGGGGTETCLCER